MQNVVPGIQDDLGPNTGEYTDGLRFSHYLGKPAQVLGSNYAALCRIEGQWDSSLNMNTTFHPFRCVR